MSTLKNNYFAEKSSAEINSEIFGRIESIIPNRKTRKIDKNRCALAVVDMQNYFQNEESRAFVPAAPNVLPKVLKLVESAQKIGLPIYLTKHIDSLEENSMKRWWRGRLEESDPLSEIVPELRGKGETIRKFSYDAFYETDLFDIMSESKIRQIVFVGVMTNLCVETSARSAFARGFDAFIVSDATAAYNLEFQIASCLNASFGFACVKTTDEIVSEFQA